MEDLKQDHEVIYLQEMSWDDEGRECDRLWCQEDEFDTPTKYIRADLFEDVSNRTGKLQTELLTLQDQNQILLKQVEYLTENNVRLNNLLKIAAEQNADLQDRYNAQEKVVEQANLHLTAAISGIIGYTSSLKEGDVVTKGYIERLESYYVNNLEQALTQLKAKEALTS